MKTYYFLFLVIILFLSGCSESVAPTENHFSSSIDGKSIVINKNHQFILELNLNADAGYQWDYSISDMSVVILDSTNYIWGNQVGGITTKNFYFRGVMAGSCGIDLFEHRVWESNVAPINTVHFSVMVK